ncbi:MAG: hypothetical protein LC772_11020, partial [Chloroflexi bacterium]|nr:hypothetical protein [Chloroflexota bacterium]
VLTHSRPYQAALDVHEALAEIGRQSGAQFDPEAVDALMRVDLGAVQHVVGSGPSVEADPLPLFPTGTASVCGVNSLPH